MSGNPTSDIAAARRFARDVELILKESVSSARTEASCGLSMHIQMRAARMALFLRYVRMMRALPPLGEMMVSRPSPHLTWYRTLNSPTVTFRTSPSRAGEPT